MADLKTDYKDDVLDTTQNTKRKYQMIDNGDGTVSFEDVTEYLQQGDSFGADDINDTNEEVNIINDNLTELNDIVSLLETISFGTSSATTIDGIIEEYITANSDWETKTTRVLNLYKIGVGASQYICIISKNGSNPNYYYTGIGFAVASSNTDKVISIYKYGSNSVNIRLMSKNAIKFDLSKISQSQTSFVGYGIVDETTRTVRLYLATNGTAVSSSNVAQSIPSAYRPSSNVQLGGIVNGTVTHLVHVTSAGYITQGLSASYTSVVCSGEYIY